MLHSSIFALVLLCFLPCFSILVIADLNSDRQVLLEFASSIPHARRLNWNDSAPVCSSWVGVTCNSNGTRVIAIHLPGVGLKGHIPENSIGKLDALRVLSLHTNGLSGSLPSDILSIPSLQYVHLQQNNFSGPIPSSVSPKLIALNIAFNSFSGTIPPVFVNLRRLTWFYLQNNSISGPVPDFNLPSLKSLNLSYNNLSGSIPNSIQKFPYTSFVGNSLCGPPLNHCSSISPSPSASSPPVYLPHSTQTPQNHKATTPKKRFGLASILALAIGGCAFLSLLVLVISFCCCKKKNGENSGGILKAKAACAGKTEISKSFGSGVQEAEKNKLFFFRGSYSFDLEDLLKASAEVLGKGSYGTAYKAVLEEGVTVVVKRLREVMVGKKEFEQQMDIVGRIGRHPNVMPLQAYYYSKDEKLLVSSYIPGGSLFASLHGNRGAGGRTPLDWDSRMKIALGVAKGIAFIHSEGGPKFTHGNIKPSNVLLTLDLDASVSDFGLTPLMNTPATMSRSNGYRAPEVTDSRKITHKSDVYSFGVLLLEMLTGKSPMRYPGRDDAVDLPRWVRSVVREEWTAEVFDEELLRGRYVEEEMVQMLQIALACAAKVPDTRPRMEEAVRMIEEIRQPELKNRTSSESESNLQTP
ncbi:putative inactive receptor kinase [Senna tora]|uniref:Putative inactive receptor kinase n=1 Tax=Senna tora TaxID=362788 RepID=A0A834U096_9FABA|nr:putative inactive receptor kinase [Senna tora]